MKQIAQSYKTGELRLTDVAAPRRAPTGGVLVATKASLISAGTERTIVDLARKNLFEKARQRPDLVRKVVDKAKREGLLATFDAVRSKLDSPFPLGYSLAGRVEDVGSAVKGFARGDRVACAGAGYANHAEVNAVPKNLVVHVPDAVSDEEAAFVTVAAIALHGVRLARPRLGEVVVVIGLGLIGQIAVQLLLAHGCDVVGLDLDRSKVDRARKLGASGAVGGVDDAVEAVRAASRGYGADAVVITASSASNEPLRLAGELARDRARISVVGLLPLEIPRKEYYEKELEVVVSRSYGPGRYDASYEERGHDYPIGYVRWTERRNLEAVLRAIEKRQLDVAGLVTHRFPFSRALDAYELITGEVAEPHLGVILEYEAASPLPPARTTSPAFARGQSGELLGVAVVGTGSFASAVLVPAIEKAPGVRIVRMVSGRGLSARHAADRVGADVAASIDDVLALAEVGAVVIATRHDSHASLAAKALAAGRHVLLEKPAAVDEDDLASLERAVHDAAAGTVLVVGYNRRFAPFACAVKAAFEGRRAGLVMTARINAGKIPSGSWLTDAREGGGRIVGEVCHFVDLMTYWAGAPPVRVSAHAIGQGGAYERDDNVVIGLTFAEGSVGTLAYSAMGDVSIGKERYEVMGEGKSATIDDWRKLEIVSRGNKRVQRALRADKGHGEEVGAFVAACAGRKPSPTPWADVKAVTLATFAIERAWRQGRDVDLSDLVERYPR